MGTVDDQTAEDALGYTTTPNGLKGAIVALTNGQATVRLSNGRIVNYAYSTQPPTPKAG